MSRTWVTADPHFFHYGVCKFMAKDGINPLRPWDDPEEMSEIMIRDWNNLVHPEDRVYLAGDVAMNRKALDKALPRLNGRIVLVRGNHDTDKLSYYSKYVDDIRSYVVKKGFIISHIPIHPGSMGRWEVNIHGHLHDGVVRKEDGTPDPRYYCVSVEHTEYKPKLLDDILKEVGLK